MRKFEGKIVVVTGGASGLGRATAMSFARQGAKVAMLDVNEQLAESTIDLIRNNGDEAIAIRCDVADQAQVTNAFNEIENKYGAVNIAHINAGIIYQPIFIHEMSIEQWNHIISVNLTGAFLCARQAIVQMMANGGGNIVFTGSNWAYVCDPGFFSYAASKGAVVSLARALALDHARDNIRINVVCPGNMNTPLLERQLSVVSNPQEVLDSMGQISTPEEVANLVLFLASEDSSAMKGSAVIIDQGETLGYGPGLSVRKK